jgi:hypothetical protein
VSHSAAQEEDLVDKPTRIFMGTGRRSGAGGTVSRLCRNACAKLGKDIQLTEYPGARHLFDDLDFRPPRYAAQIQTSRRCRLEENATGGYRQYRDEAAAQLQ